MLNCQPRSFLLILGAFTCAILTGCSDGYSSAIEYGLREDPILEGKANDLAKERPKDYAFFFKADPPGQLPLLSMAGFDDERNPYYPIRDKARKYFRDPRKIRAQDAKVFEDALREVFGTPSKPRVNVASVQELDQLKLDRATLAHGSSLYRLQCLQCHGVTGDGRGPTGQWVNPHPRDYRPGLFKFSSVDQTGGLRKPLREDLHRTLYWGVEGTSMPAFNLLTKDEIDALVSYVIHLSIRGDTEIQVFKKLNVDKKSGMLTSEGMDGTIRDLVFGYAKATFKQWQSSQKDPIKTALYPYGKDQEKKQSILRGYALYTQDMKLLKKYFPKEYFVSKYSKEFKDKDGNAKDADSVTDKEYEEKLVTFKEGVNCVTCHFDLGRQAEFTFDEWGTLVKPANWTLGVYRGGRRPIDLYWRIHSGINGSGMIAYGGILHSDQIWDMVNFIRAIPYPAMHPEGMDIE